MTFRIYRSRYFIFTGILLFVCFAVIGIFISVQSGKRTRQISIDMATKVYQLKSAVVRNEFNHFLEGIHQVAPVIAQAPSAEVFQQQLPLIETLLLNHPAINNGWYAIVRGGDTLMRAVQKLSTSYSHPPLQSYQVNWISRQLAQTDSVAQTAGIISVADSLHWMTAHKIQLANATELALGLDINLVQLQHYLWSVDTTGRAYAFILNEDSVCITHPDESQLGKKLSLVAQPANSRHFLGDSVTSYETVNSTYLQLPVIRYYTPLHLWGQHWTLVVDTPVLAVDEDVKAVEKYMLILFVSTAIIILSLIAWAQTKWQNEFLLREQAERNRQELLAEKQALSLAAERQEKHNALLQLNTLKEKVNPHFLFNSLSSLNALIDQNQQLAKSFVMKLSKVYRYVLDDYPNGLVTVATELQFANEYFFLLKIRFGQALEPLQIEIADKHLAQHLPFMSLQTGIENAVKHNALSREAPLQISIRSEGNWIVVSNNLQPRKDVPDSGKQGLQYLASTYTYLDTPGFRHGVEGDTYTCYLPLLP
ncbi:Single cache domain 3-containing protein [Filimonas lacunae]|uniref:Single cache domain 3-containing protein n=1 Tax=Filimonas lacunae TaxID=477680 RepID=A0A173MHT1_9BACT|nr:histidine kinase [Filimonas lacunae]BAV07046.1 two-component system sensor protein histidine kinase [Filimonas lacunae]SIS95759.1 Single cache domain 3-containing protein [Filimonas lacunae]